MVDRGQAHGAQDSVGDWTRARDLQKVMPDRMRIEFQHGCPAIEDAGDDVGIFVCKIQTAVDEVG
jgi:hypothetical protein